MIDICFPIALDDIPAAVSELEADMKKWKALEKTAQNGWRKCYNLLQAARAECIHAETETVGKDWPITHCSICGEFLR